MERQRMMLVSLVMAGLVCQVTALVCGKDITMWAKKLAAGYPYNPVKTPDWPAMAREKLLNLIPGPRTNSDMEKEVIKQILIKAYNFAVLDSHDPDPRLTAAVKEQITVLAKALASKCSIGVGWSEKAWLVVAGDELEQMDRFGLDTRFLLDRVLAQSLVLAQERCGAKVKSLDVENACA